MHGHRRGGGVLHRHGESARAGVTRGVGCGDGHGGHAERENRAAFLRIGERRADRHGIGRAACGVIDQRAQRAQRLRDDIGMRGHHRGGGVLHRHGESPGRRLARRVRGAHRHRGRAEGENRPAFLRVSQAGHPGNARRTHRVVVHDRTGRAGGFHGHAGMRGHHAGVGRIGQGVEAIEGSDAEEIDLVRVQRPGGVICLIRRRAPGHGKITPVGALLDAEAVLIGGQIRPRERTARSGRIAGCRRRVGQPVRDPVAEERDVRLVEFAGGERRHAGEAIGHGHAVQHHGVRGVARHDEFVQRVAGVVA